MMITVNLRPGQKRKRTASPLAGIREKLSGFGSSVKDPLLAAAVAAWVLVGGWLAWVFVNNTRELATWEPRLEQARTENRRFQTVLKQKQRQELIRDSLAAQVQVIRNIDSDRYVWPHVLDEVSRALPAYTWLVDVTNTAPPAPPAGTEAAPDTATTARPPVNFRITGRTVDIQAYTRFLRQLEASPWIQNVAPQQVQTIVEKERAVTAFTVLASFVTADSAYIRTVPLSQSVR